MKMTKKDYLCCLTCVAFAVLLNLVLPYVLKLVPLTGSDPVSEALRRMQDNAHHPVSSSLCLAVYVFVACCLGKMFPLFK
jgi:hypothetical protein